VTLHIKVDGAWVQCDRPYVKRNGVWVAASQAWYKTGGVWKQAYDYDVTPPNPPEVTLTIVEDFDKVNGKDVLKTRYIKVGTKLPGTSNDPDARLTRVLTNYQGKPPSTQYGGQYTSEADKDWRGEPWSEWRYNSYGDHNNTSNITYKQWPPNVQAGFTIAGDKDYYFGAWSLDNSGNWSTVTQAAIHVPKDSVATDNIVVKEARFQPNTSGSWRSDGFHGGDLIQQQNPKAYGLWFHGSQFSDAIGKQGKPTIRSAQIRIAREGADEDTGNANANLYLFWHGYPTTGSLPAPTAPGGLTVHEITKLGQLAKGEAKWFPLPDAFNADLNTNVKGMGLYWKDPDKASAFPADYSRIVGSAQALRCGEVHVTWEEQL
jgi:hypothetical protein